MEQPTEQNDQLAKLFVACDQALKHLAGRETEFSKWAVAALCAEAIFPFKTEMGRRCDEAIVQEIFKETATGAIDRPDYPNAGKEALWFWFGCSRASFLTLPRVMMHAMPDQWQCQMAELLEQYDNTFPNQPDIGTRVQAVQGTRLVKFPEWVLNYRHPDHAAIDATRGTRL
ncbi:hypothetical protein NH8B_0956 [Pseudogulbenkiania sp. NH8B]|uniref:hypothetical protein n=1 Tax=Pseudogulbenkiania sp. (strain NH8B) TaxID=748280 RepID=UPI0002279A7A|nr:hypothetical protein [Pseudogulbenkiania sp. NH8B]BAK75788.1 hypothetical protein NH8B_0956 [Pseudogulbenkiania sp. NH8B]